MHGRVRKALAEATKGGRKRREEEEKVRHGSFARRKKVICGGSPSMFVVGSVEEVRRCPMWVL